MADTFELEIATPERLVFRDQVTEAQIPAKDGYLGVLPDHAPLLSELGSGVLSFSSPNHPSEKMALTGGYVEVLPDHVRVLANIAEKASEIDIEMARQELEKSLKELESPMGEASDVARALDCMYHAQAKLAATQK